MEPTPTSPNRWVVIGIVAVAVLVVVFVVIYAVNPAAIQKDTSISTTPTATPTPTPITTNADLQTASSDLDKVDVDSVDANLKLNDTDAASF